MTDNNFKLGDELIHKATYKRCVVIEINKDDTLKVKTSDDIEKDYYPVELRKSQSGTVHRRKRNIY